MTSLIPTYYADLSALMRQMEKQIDNLDGMEAPWVCDALDLIEDAVRLLDGRECPGCGQWHHKTEVCCQMPAAKGE